MKKSVRFFLALWMVVLCLGFGLAQAGEHPTSEHPTSTQTADVSSESAGQDTTVVPVE